MDIKNNDLVFAVYKNVGSGTIYQVEEITPTGILKLRPVFCLQPGPHKHRLRTLGAGWVKKVTIENLTVVLSELDTFLRELRQQKQ